MRSWSRPASPARAGRTRRQWPTKWSANFRLAGGGRITLVSETGSINPGEAVAHFTGGVRITSTDGMVVETETLEAALSGLEAQSPGPVQASGALGRLTAGNMAITAKSGSGPVHMVFKNGVKLLYDPQQSER